MNAEAPTPRAVEAGQPDRAMRAGLAYAIGAAFFLSVNNTALSPYYAAGGTIAAMMFARYAFYCGAVGLACRASGHSLAVPREDRLRVSIIGLLYAGGILSLLTAFTRIPIPLAVLVLYLFPIFTTLLIAALDRRLPGPLFLACLTAALAGLAIALEVTDLRHEPVGLAAAVFAAAGFALTFVLSGRWFRDVPAMVLSYRISLPGLGAMTLLFVGWLLLANSGALSAPSAPSAASDLGTAGAAVASGALRGSGGLQTGLPATVSGALAGALAVAAYTLGILTMFMALARVGGPSTAMAMNLEPILTLALVAYFLREPLSAASVLGAVIVQR